MPKRPRTGIEPGSLATRATLWAHQIRFVRFYGVNKFYQKSNSFHLILHPFRYQNPLLSPYPFFDTPGSFSRRRSHIFYAIIFKKWSALVLVTQWIKFQICSSTVKKNLLLKSWTIYHLTKLITILCGVVFLTVLVKY